ncbi:hypothetical protein EWB00_010990 [Schistosoma japonicum]|uniref:Uncharacterized protein n=1 Tax=Schistosoma japonicum TaxID=6182 RepID=A0A4Z2DMD5_SCHJA|nr:hypothetical protein EWB00_010990 [Schistosoma japonicum]
MGKLPLTAGKDCLGWISMEDTEKWTISWRYSRHRIRRRTITIARHIVVKLDHCQHGNIEH